MLIQQQNELDDVCGRLAACDWFTLDTEFFREKTYFAKLCLIQVATPNFAACIDPQVPLDLSGFFALLANEKITKVLHSAYQDLEIFHQLSSLPIRNLFDTQLAAPLLGLPETTGYARLVEHYLDIQLDKSQVRTDWRKRPLSKAQIDYALGDVIHLAEIYPQMRTTLQDQGRLDWLTEEFAALEDPQAFQTAPEAAYLRVKGVNYLNAAQLNTLRELAAWRENWAVSHDIPRRQVTKDEVLVDLARLQPNVNAEFARIRGFGRGPLSASITRDLFAAAAQVDKRDYPVRFKKPVRDSRFDEQLALLSAAVHTIARDAGVAASVLANQKQLAAFIDAPENSTLMQGWRRRLAGEKLLAILRGDAGLVLNDGELIFWSKNEPANHSNPH